MGALVAARHNSALLGGSMAPGRPPPRGGPPPPPPPQFRAQGLPSAPPRRRKTKAGRNRRRRPKAPHHPQRYHPRAKAMAPSLTAKPVAPPLWGRTEEGGRAVLRDEPARGRSIISPVPATPPPNG